MKLQGQLVHSIRLDPNTSQKWQQNGNWRLLTKQKDGLKIRRLTKEAKEAGTRLPFNCQVPALPKVCPMSPRSSRIWRASSRSWFAECHHILMMMIDFVRVRIPERIKRLDRVEQNCRSAERG